MYSRKLYVAVAALMLKNRKAAPVGTAGQTTVLAACMKIEDDLADLFANDNPNFDRARFLAACEGE